MTAPWKQARREQDKARRQRDEAHAALKGSPVLPVLPPSPKPEPWYEVLVGLRRRLVAEGWTGFDWNREPGVLVCWSVCSHGQTVTVMVSEMVLAEMPPHSAVLYMAEGLNTECSHHVAPLTVTYQISPFGPPPMVEDLVRLVPALAEAAVCPECSITGRLDRMIAHLNDSHRWSRQQIAGWGRTLAVDATVAAAPKGD